MKPTKVSKRSGVVTISLDVGNSLVEDGLLRICDDEEGEDDDADETLRDDGDSTFINPNLQREDFSIFG